jgi:hypothetical protein
MCGRWTRIEGGVSMSRHASGFGIAVVAPLVALIAAAATIASASAAVSGPTPIGPHQFFRATVNGATGDQGRVNIGLGCVGPIHPGETGHPLPDQMVGVQFMQPPPSSIPLGYTGDRGTSIGAFFGAPPPRSPSSASYVNFTSYGLKGIPTTLVLPCSGTGQVTFVALPLDPSERSTAVPVRFVPQP